jgi:hypothetical protein
MLVETAQRAMRLSSLDGVRTSRSEHRGERTVHAAVSDRIWTHGWTEVIDGEHTRRMRALDRGNRRWRLTPGPESSQAQRGHHRMRDFQDDLPACPHHLGCDVDHHASDGGGITGHRYHLAQHIFLEGLREKEGDQHTVVEGGIGRKPFEGECLTAKIFQPAMREFVGSSAMVAGDERRGLGPVSAVIDGCVGQHRGIHPQVGQDNRVRTGKVQQALSIRFRHGSGVQRPVVPCPALTPPPELQILPFLMPIVIGRPLSGGLRPDIGFDRLVHFPRHDDAHLQLVTGPQNGFIEKATIEADDDHDLGSASLPHQGHHPAEHIDNGVARVAVLASPAKDRIDNLARPDHLQGLKAFDAFVGGLDAMPCRGLVVIQDHGIDGGLDHPGARQLEPPHTQLIEDRAEAPARRPRKGFEQPLHRMGRRQLGTRGLKRGGISRIPLQVIEIPQVPAGAVQEETEELLEEGPKRQALPAFAERAKGLFQERRNLDLREVADEEG